MTADRRAVKRRGEARFDRGAFFRLSRLVHAYVSAFAFLALIFFSATGLLIDHPEWIKGKTDERTVKVSLSPDDLAAAARAGDPTAVLAAEVSRLAPLIGVYKDGEIDDGQANVRLEGVKGASTILVDMRTGAADVTIEAASALGVLGDLHRGKNAGAAWRLVIDLSSILILTLSVVGYALFFSLRFRLRTSLVLTAASLGLFGAVFVFLTP